MIVPDLATARSRGLTVVDPPSSGVFGCLSLTLATGMILAVKSVRPTLAVELIPMQIVQPLHTLGAIGFLLCGIAMLRVLVLRKAGLAGTRRGSTATAILAGFVTVAGVLIVAGHGSGLEYVTWPLPLTVVPVGVMVALAVDTWRQLSRLSAISPEGAWLLLTGLCLAPLGMIERLLGVSSQNVTRSLMLEWHALDTVFAGFNTAIYGAAILLVCEPGKLRPARSLWLYAVAVFALLSTFGHHHYVSAQPGGLKWIAFVASMLGLVSFVRHVVAASRSARGSPRTPASHLFLSASFWTIFAVGSGILMAVPHLNLVLHGTHAVVGHAMGAMIGINGMIILGAVIDAHPDPRRSVIRWGVTLCNVSLALLVVDLVAAGVVKGILRLDAGYHEYQPVVRFLLLPLPVFGLMLAGSIALLVRESVPPRVGVTVTRHFSISSNNKHHRSPGQLGGRPLGGRGETIGEGRR